MQSKSERPVTLRMSATIISAILILFGLYLANLYNYLLFHSLAEIFSIVVASGIFIVAWNSRRFLDNNYLLFIGIAYLFIACLDLVHTLGYTGMGIFHGYGTNLPAQLWIATRYMESLSLLIAPLFLGRRLKPDLVLMGYALATLLVLGSVFYWNIFPTCFVEGVGLTPFKKISEYIISIILLGAITLLFQKRKEFDERVFRLLVAAMVITIASDLAFTLYIHAYGFSNLVGHYFKIISFYLIYKAIIETGLVRPYDLMFRNLKQSEEALREAHDKLEQRVEERTTELMKTNEQMAREISERSRAEEALRRANRAFKALSECNQAVVRANDESYLLHEICRIIVDVGGYRLAWVGFAGQDEGKTVRPVAQAGYEEGYLDTMDITWADTEKGRGPTGTTIRTGKRSIAKNLLTDPNYAPWRAEATRRSYASSIALPLISDGQAFGALNVYAKDPDAFDAEAVRLLTELTDDLAYGIMALRTLAARKRVEEDLKKHQERLEELVKARTSELEEKTTELEQANIILQELDRLKSMFIASMSHELRTPLNSIIGFTGIILQGMTGEINPEQRDQLERVYGSAKHLLALINDVIDISKIEAGKFEVHAEEFDLDGVIREAVSNLTPEITSKGLGLEISLPQNIQLTSDRRRLLQCVLNFLSNAVKFTEKGNIRIAVHELEEMIEIGVEDTGIGIKEEDIPKIFASFVRLDSPLRTKAPGAGLGLYLTKKIATEMLKGSVFVESRFGEGSVFGMRVPKRIKMPKMS